MPDERDSDMSGAMVSNYSPQMPKNSKDKVEVAIRMRPFSKAEQQHGSRSCVTMTGQEVTVRCDDAASRSFRFDHCFNSVEGSKSSVRQEHLFEELGSHVLSHAWQGFNSSVFCYGQTGSGKTYTITGGEGDEEGLLPRIGRALLQSIEDKKQRQPEMDADQVDGSVEGDAEYSVRATYVEIYNEKVYDLLAPLQTQGGNLRVREHPKTGPYVEGAVVKEMSSWDDLKSCLDYGQKTRHVAATNMNFESSRSHVIFTLEFRQSFCRRGGLIDETDDLSTAGGIERMSRICLVDLAGSERADKTGATGMRLRESGNINKSLSALGNVINALADAASENFSAIRSPNGTSFIPYRDSVLTWLLSDSLGGNAKTIMVATISPSPVQVEETLSTLHYANRAKCIVTHPTVNEDPKDRYIRNLENRIKQLEEGQPSASSSPAAGDMGMRTPTRDVESPQAGGRGVLDDMARQISTLRLQNFARATLLNHASVKLQTSAGTPERADAPVAAGALSPLNYARRSVSELPKLVRLSEHESLGNEKQAFPLSTARTRFDAEGMVVGRDSTREVAFIIEFNNDRLQVTVPPSKSLFINGTEFGYESAAEAVHMEIWSGTRLAVDPKRVFLLLFEPTSSSIKGSPSLSPGSSRRFNSHNSTWAALRNHPALCWTAAQAELRRGFALTVDDVLALKRDGALDEPKTRGAFDVSSGYVRGQGLGLPAPKTHIVNHEDIELEEASRVAESAAGSSVGSMHAPKAPNVGTSRFSRQAKTPSPSPGLSMATAPVNRLSSNTNSIRALGPPVSPVAHPQKPFKPVPKQPQAASLLSYDFEGLLPRTFELQNQVVNAEKTITGLSLQQVYKETYMATMVEDVISLLPLVIEANTLAQGLNRPILFYIDTALCSSSDNPVRVAAEALRNNGMMDAAEVLDPHFYGSDEDSTLPPPVLALATKEQRVVVRTLNWLNNSTSTVPVDSFKELVRSLRITHAKYKASNGQNGDFRSPFSSQEEPEGLGVSTEVDPFLVDGDAITLGRSDVYLASLLQRRQIAGLFPLLRSLDGGCMGTVALRIFPLDDLPTRSQGTYEVRLELDSLQIDRSQLAGILQADALQTPALRYHDEAQPQLLLRYSFFHEEFTGEIPIGRRSTIMKASKEPGSTKERIHFNLDFHTTFKVTDIDARFLSFLAANSLQLEIIVGKDPAERDIWGRALAVPQGVSERHTAYEKVRVLDIPCFEDDGEVRAVSSGMQMNMAASDDPEELYSVSGAMTACERGSMYSNRYSTRHSVRRSQFLQAYANSTLLYLAVDILEPVVEPDVDYFSEAPTHFAPVDFKPCRGSRPSSMRFLSSASEAMSMTSGYRPRSTMGHPGMMMGGGGGQPSRSEIMDDDDISDRVSEAWTELSTVAENNGIPGTAGSEPVFHILASPLIRTRHLRLVLEQVEPLARFSVESCPRIMTSSYVNMFAREYEGDITMHTTCDCELVLLSVTRSSCRRRLEIRAEMPMAQALYEQCVKGERVILMLEVWVYLEGVAQPVKLTKNLVMKVIPPARKTGFMYNFRKSLKPVHRDRLHSIGSYYAVRTENPHYIREAAADFVAFKTQCLEKLLYRMSKTRDVQLDKGRALPHSINSTAVPLPGASEAVADLRNVDGRCPPCEFTTHYWQELLSSPRRDAASSPASVPSTLDPAAIQEFIRSQPQLASNPNVEELVRMLANSVGSKSEQEPSRKESAVAAMFGVEVVRKDNRDDDSHGERPSMSPSPAFTYEYSMAPRKEHRDWDVLAKVWAQEVPDVPAIKEGYLNVRTGLLGANWARAWFVWRRPFLFQYATKNNRKPLKVLYVTDCRIGRGRDDLDIVLRGPVKTWCMQAANEEDLHGWMHAFDPAGFDANMGSVCSDY